MVTVYKRGWSQLENGALLDVAEKEGFAVLVTTDANLKHQQNLSFLTIAIVVLTTTSWPRIQRAVERWMPLPPGATRRSRFRKDFYPSMEGR